MIDDDDNDDDNNYNNEESHPALCSLRALGNAERQRFRSCEEVLLDASVTRDDRGNGVQRLRSDGCLSQLPDRRQHQRTS